MALDVTSTTVFAPLPHIALYEPLGRRGEGSVPRSQLRGYFRPKANTSASSVSIDELPLQIAGERAASVVDKVQLATEISKRLQFLKIEAEIDRVPFSDASLADFQTFMQAASPRARPFLFLNDNGNLRALWKNDQREQIGLQFLGGGNIQFVIFKQRKGTLAMARVSGIDAFDKIFGHIKATGAEGLFFG